MDTDYDRKFEEMKKYIPFLESMIKRLESTGTTSSNPRQAQLAKIRSLRDLLLDKKKRMKMENLLKCEQVLVNLYAKVEQRDSFTDTKSDMNKSLNTQNLQLDFVRNKLKTVTSKLQDPETLPEIARASQTEEICTAGGKEPALFQRRPNKNSISPTRCSLNSSRDILSPSGRRSYTRVLVSPERDTKQWPLDKSSDKPLFCRRSPRRTPRKSPKKSPRKSPRKGSPLSRHKKERKKSYNQSRTSHKLQDLNITLKVPEESLSSLNTKDILSRIINCSDGDVDIDTLRELRTQILSELKQTGAKDDISDLILKSYKNKKEVVKKKDEVEEGELSDSESEVIESIYGSLVIMDKDQGNTNSEKKSSDKDQPRKIQICLVINSEKEKLNDSDRAKDISDQNAVIDKSDFESYKETSKGVQKVDCQTLEVEKDKNNQDQVSNKLEISSTILDAENNEQSIKNTDNSYGMIQKSNDEREEKKQEINIISELPEAFSPNFYQPQAIIHQDASAASLNLNISSPISTDAQTNDKSEQKLKDLKKEKDSVEIPLLDLESTAKQEVVHEIDILQALKNEILSEKISIDDSETMTPLLHQPKVTKVANIEGIVSKKRISIEKYKQKSISASKSSTLINDTNSNAYRDELSKKQSIKLTEKEFERFNLSSKLALGESSEDEEFEKRSPTNDDIYGDLAPKSPDHEDFADTGIKPPVIIPADPVKTTVVTNADVDMRTLTMQAALSSQVSTLKTEAHVLSPTGNFDKAFDICKNDVESGVVTNDKRLPLADPRVRKEFNLPNTDTPILGNVERTSRSHINFTPNMTPNRMSNIVSNMTPNRMPNIAQSPNIITNMTSNLTSNTNVYEMTPSRQPLDSDDYLKRNHVYAPIFSVVETHDPNDAVSNDFQNPLYSEANSTMFNRLECPQTPMHSFGATDCPSTPTHTFGLLETPMTPIHTFGRSDMPMTPVPSFGRADCPPTPIHPFGRTEVMMTPSHPFGVTDFSQNQLPSQMSSIRYSKVQDPRINRNSEYDNLPKYNDMKDCGKYQERNFNNRNYKYDPPKRAYADSYRNYGREQSVGRNDKNATYEQIENRHGERLRRENSSGRLNRNYEVDRNYSNDRGKAYRDRDHRCDNDGGKIYYDHNSRWNYRREHSVGRAVPENRHIGTHHEREVRPENSLCVQSHAGRSFTIDTSVSRSFQESLENLKKESISESNFDVRRRRASSVGRSLIREPSIGKELTSLGNSFSSVIKSNNNFRRASSVGRDMVKNHDIKNFKDIKDDLQSYKYKSDVKNYDRKNISSEHGIFPEVKKKINDRDPRLSRRDNQDLHYNNSSGQSLNPYSQKKNYRDPRHRREFRKEITKKFHSFQDQTRGKSYEFKKHGIVYSSDNIAKGTILGSGYGVKNYKIPKIKRPLEETESKNSIDKLKPSGSVTNSSCKKAEDVSKDLITVEKTQNKEKIIEKDKTKEKNRSTRWESPDKLNSFKQESEKISSNHSDSVEKRITRSARKNTISEIKDFNCESPIKRGNRTSKTVIYDSDTDNVEIDTNKDLQNEKFQDSKEKGKKDTKNNHVDDYRNSVKLNNEKKSCAQAAALMNVEENNSSQMTKGFMMDDGHKEPKRCEPIESSVSLEDNLPVPVTDDTNNCFGMELEMFSDSVATDPVIDNINALIADLDDDLETSKNDGYKNQFTKEITLENMLDNITCMDNKKSVSVDINEQEEIKGTEEIKLNDSDKNVVSDLLQNDENNKHKNNDDVISENNSEVSTTDNENPLVQADILSPSKTNISQLQSCSTPDSTIDVNENLQDKVGQERMPDSTNELACEMSSDITSTHDSHEVFQKAQVETNISRTELSHQTDNIGSLLSILKDKSKIKELLTMLKDQSSENDKLKKKLEKLSEIVSDDDDSLHDESNSLHNEKINFSTSNNNNESESAGNTGVHTDTTPTAESISSCEKNDQSIQNKNNVEAILDEQFKEHEQNVTSAENCEDKESFEDTKKNTKNDDDTVETVCKKSTKITKSTKKAKGKVKNYRSGNKKRLTRSESANLKMNKPSNIKKPSRELKQLQDDIKEMFLHDDVFNATGIRMCRLAKLVEDKPIDKSETQNNENSPVVILEKIKESSEETTIKGKTSKKKATFKSKMLQKEVFDSEKKTESSNENINSELKMPIKYRPGPKSKTKLIDKQAEVDPYIFESDSVSESNATNISETKPHSSSDSECESLESSKSFGSTELLVELKKKPKRKRRGWQAGVIKPKHKKKKTDLSHTQSDTTLQVMTQIPDLNCFTDKTYCFYKNVSVYSCRLCLFNGNDIVHHYKKQHPHSEIPLSRMSPEVAKEAIEQCEEINFHAISKVTTDKYVCRFCFKEFKNSIKKKTVLEEFFWHVVSMHTGEYKQLCSECINVTRCPFNLDIPPPPKEQKGQLIGYICGKCNFTQISLENLKTHVINRHNDEQTEVYTINLAVMSKKTLLAFSKSTSEQPRTLRSSRSNQSTVETNDEHSDFNESSDNANESDKVTPIPQKEETLIELQKNKRNKIQSQITFETDDAANELCELNKNKSVKVEQEHEIDAQDSSPYNEPVDDAPIAEMVTQSLETIKNADYNQPSTSDDILDYPHFKINFTEAGTKEYVCCINGVENHYRTALLISFKKHVQIKHTEKWDGFCFLCKLIVTPQGNHNFKDCLQHFLDKHFDNFPTMEKVDDKKNNMKTSDVKPRKNYLNVRPLSELISQSEIQSEQPKLPVIESVVSLGGSTDEASSGISIDSAKIINNEKEFKYEQAQAEIIAKKNNVVLDVMMNREKLVHIFKCAGRFCSYSTDNAEDALRHAITHERVGGENSLNCTYCDFDSSKNAVDLVTHVFKMHGCCQYVCGHCFYRSAASQLVRAHASRIHGKAPGQSVILRTTVTARSDTECKILPREIAVPFFGCNQNVMDAKCKFKTYTSGKFYEHLQMRHQLDISFLCFMCSEEFTKPVDLLQHFKIHGLKLYQCTWCIHGAENETELLAHASEKHPNKQPQAYLRVITNKEGTPGFRVLPLAHLNNSKITTIDVKPNNVRGNPEREAERSIDLEKLIGQTTQMIESMVTSSQNESTENYTLKEQETISVPSFEPGSLAQSQESLVLALQSSLFDKTPETSILTDVGPAPITADLSRPETPNLASQPINSDVHSQLTPVLKGEPEPNTPEKTDSDVVYCLDSDEEISNQNVVDLSSEESPLVAVVIDKSGKLEKVPLSRLFKCSVCSMILKSSSGFKRHVSACHTEATNLLPCAYCPFVAQRDLVVKHYISDHCLSRKEATRYVCGVCSNKYISFTFVKKHLKDDHNLSKLVVTSKLVTNGEYQFVVGEASKQKQVAKRKLSNDNEDKSLQPVFKMKKFGPNDVNLLPINPILDELVYCSLCEFSTKVRLNMVRHLQLHAEQQPVPQTAPVNPVPHLETNEKHFDKMVNLASSSIASRAPEKSNKIDRQAVVNLLIPPEAASRYPKYVPDRQRYTCGAKGCCYISVDETMLKYHWETLHSGANDFHCVHCPPYQQLDTTKPLTASRIIAHLKMHDIRLYACSSCSYYHHRRQVLDKHIAEIHSTGHVMVVREESVSQTQNVTQPSTVAPTMDLKPWQCGLCKFKSMLRPEVVEHCAKIHQSKMQYKCTYCAFRTSTLENITKHQSKSHAGKVQETFYFYYREGSIPDESDGTPRWQKQRQKSGVTETEVKTETIERTELDSQSDLTKNVPQPPAEPAVDLNIVKQDPDAVLIPAHTTQDLCRTFGQFCEPNGLKYKCPLCKNVLEDCRDAMQSHLYEELQYRKWGCGFCTYKAFHKNGLNDHMFTEHRQNREPIELPVDVRVEAWIAKLLDYQFLLIEKNRQNLPKQSIAEKPVNSAPTTSKSQDAHMNVPESDNGYSEEELEKMFGTFGASENKYFHCPKCSLKIMEESAMRDHLEIELNKIRWCCNSCTEKFQNYHEAQFHCKSVHPGISARAIEAVRSVGLRSAWISAVIRAQKLSMNRLPVTETTDSDETTENSLAQDNSLLVVRYEERVPTPEVQVIRPRTSAADSDEDEEKLVIDEVFHQMDTKQCPFCMYTCQDIRELKEHVVSRHNNIKPYFCSYCDFNGYRKTVVKHVSDKHKDKPLVLLTKGQRILGPPIGGNPVPASAPVAVEDESPRLICLRCEKSFSENEAKTHLHDNTKPTFGKKGQIAVKCSSCWTLHEDINAAVAHHHTSHPNKTFNYSYHKLHYYKRSIFCCAYCDQNFSLWGDLKVHWKAVHSSLPLQFNKRQYAGTASDVVINLSDDEETGVKRKSESTLPNPSPSKMCARKSTTKLPFQAVAKKSTTKLPFNLESDSDSMEYSFYGSKPQVDNLDKVTTNMSFCNTVVPFTFKKLSEVIHINPTVLVEDIKK